MKIGTIILAAGQSKRMKSDIPKVIHPLLGKSLISYSIETAMEVSSTKPVVVVGYEHEKVRQAIHEDVEFTLQEEQLGTAHAVMTAENVLKGKVDLIVVFYADMPLIRSETFSELINLQKTNEGPLSLVSVSGKDSKGFGRVVRNNSGNAEKIVEEKAATTEQLKIQEYNAGIYCIQAGWLWQALTKIKKAKVGEYYLTDLVEIAVNEKAKAKVNVLQIDDINEALGINNRVHFAEAQKILQTRINNQWMLEGVTIIDPDRTHIDETVNIAQDVVLYPETYLHGSTTIGKGSVIGPMSIIRDTKVGKDCTILASTTEGAILEDHVEIGPYCRLRKGAHLADHVHMGNFGEVKNSYLGEGTKMGHFSYIGDAEIGKDVNIGAGTITCNYDGEKKNKTIIGDNTFIGSDTMLVAPIKIGKNAVTGAGAVVNKEVKDNEKVVGVPAHPIKPSREVKKDE